MWQSEGQDRCPVAGEIRQAEDEIEQRRGEKNDARNTVEIVKRGVEVAEALRDAEAAAEQRVVSTQDRCHATGPTNALADVAGEGFGGEPGCLSDVDVGGIPAGTLEPKRGVGVLGDSVLRDASDLFQRSAADHGAGAAEESRVPEIVSVLHDAVEKTALVRCGAELVEVALKRIGGVEVMRRLHESEVAIGEKPAHGELQKAAGGHVIAVEDSHVLAEVLVD